MINEHLVGTWWAFKNGDVYALFRGDTCCDRLCRLPDNAVTRWVHPNKPEFGPWFWAKSSPEILDVSKITFPPIDYLEDNSITEIEINSNGDYIIFDSIKI